MSEVPVINFLKLPAVEKRVGMKRSTIYSLIRDGKFPAPVKRGHASYWPDTTIYAWQQAQLAA